MDKLEQYLQQATARADQRRQALRDRHRADVAHVQREHREIADWLTVYVAAFGRGEIDYRVVLRK